MTGGHKRECRHCGRLAEHRSRGLCSGCYQTLQRDGGLEAYGVKPPTLSPSREKISAERVKAMMADQADFIAECRRCKEPAQTW